MEKEKLTAEQYNRRGVEYAKLGNYKEALLEFDKAVGLNPNLAKAFNGRGLTKSRLGKYKEAVADLDRALELNPEYAEAHNNRGGAKADLEDAKGSIFDFSKAIELKPNYAVAYLNRAKVRLGVGDFEGATADYNAVLKLKPRSSAAYHGRAIVKARMGDHKGSLEDLDRVIKLKPEDKWLGDEYSEDALAKPQHHKGRKSFSLDEERDADATDYRNKLMDADYLDAIVNLQLPTETYLRIRMLQRFGYRYTEAAKALGIPTQTLWLTTQRVLKKLKKVIPSR